MPTQVAGEYMAFRPGDLGEKIELAAKKDGCSKSDIVRKALEIFLEAEPMRPLAVYLGAASSFGAVAHAAFRAGFFPPESYDRLTKALRETSETVQEKLEPLFRQIHPGAETPSEFRDRTNRGLSRRPEGLTDNEMIGSEKVERWQSALGTFGHFPDLQDARRVLLRQLNANSSELQTFDTGLRESKKITKKRKGK